MYQYTVVCSGLDLTLCVYVCVCTAVQYAIGSLSVLALVFYKPSSSTPSILMDRKHELCRFPSSVKVAYEPCDSMNIPWNTKLDLTLIVSIMLFRPKRHAASRKTWPNLPQPKAEP